MEFCMIQLVLNWSCVNLLFVLCWGYKLSFDHGVRQVQKSNMAIWKREKCRNCIIWPSTSSGLLTLCPEERWHKPPHTSDSLSWSWTHPPCCLLPEWNLPEKAMTGRQIVKDGMHHIITAAWIHSLTVMRFAICLMVVIRSECVCPVCGA